eukprot:jgi/Orpsp1_1/1187273/evm.model.d7180000056508.1
MNNIIFYFHICFILNYVFSTINEDLCKGIPNEVENLVKTNRIKNVCNIKTNSPFIPYIIISIIVAIILIIAIVSYCIYTDNRDNNKKRTQSTSNGTLDRNQPNSNSYKNESIPTGMNVTDDIDITDANKKNK